MTANWFLALCDELGYDPHSIVSVRVSASRAVVVVKNARGELQLSNYEHTDGRLRLVSEGRPVGPWPRPA